MRSAIVGYEVQFLILRCGDGEGLLDESICFVFVALQAILHVIRVFPLR